MQMKLVRYGNLFGELQLLMEIYDAMDNLRMYSASGPLSHCCSRDRDKAYFWSSAKMPFVLEKSLFNTNHTLLTHKKDLFPVTTDRDGFFSMGEPPFSYKAHVEFGLCVVPNQDADVDEKHNLYMISDTNKRWPCL